MNPVYEVRFVLTEGLESANRETPASFEDGKLQNNDVKESEEIVSDKSAKKQKAKIIGTAATAVGITMTAVNTYYAYEQTNYDIAGDFVGAQKQANEQATVNELVGVASTIGMGLAVGGLPGGAAALALLAVNYSRKAINHSIQTRKYLAQMQASLKESNYKRERLITNIVEVR